YGHSQQRTISGEVRADGDILPGVNVVVKATTNGVSSDFDGKFSINISSPNAVLVFSYSGFETQEIAVGSNSTLNVTMKESDSALDEVVVVGYGTQKKRDVVGAISSVKAEDLVLSTT